MANGHEWWKESVVYQIYPRSFKDSNGTGVGDIRGIIEKLDYLSDLGVDVIWLSPFFKSPMVDNGYDISNYYQVDPLFGTNEDLEELIDKAADKGIKLLFDLVINHCSSEHEWFKKAMSDPSSKERDYFIIKKESEINNLRSIFGGSSWEKIEDSDEYYMHVFAKEQPDLNWENKALRQELYDMINYWLDKGIGGFRIDAITYIKKNQEFPKFTENLDDQGLVSVDLGAINQKGIGDFLQELKRETFDKYDCVTVGEAFGVPLDELKYFTGENGHFNMIFEFSYAHPSTIKHRPWYEYQEWSIDDWKKQIYEAQSVSQKVGWSPTHLENHDSPRSLNVFIPEGDISLESSKMLAMLYFYLRGTPFIYQGQEIGMRNNTLTTIEEFDDLFTKDQYQIAIDHGFDKDEAFRLITPRSRDHARTPFLWDDSENAGFTTGTPWLKVDTYYKDTNAKRALLESNSLFHWYKKLIALRKLYKSTLVYGFMKPVLENENNIVAYERYTDDECLVMIANFQNKEAEVTYAIDEVILTNYDNLARHEKRLVLKPYQCVLAKVRKGN